MLIPDNLYLLLTTGWVAQPVKALSPVTMERETPLPHPRIRAKITSLPNVGCFREMIWLELHMMVIPGNFQLPTLDTRTASAGYHNLMYCINVYCMICMYPLNYFFIWKSKSLLAHLLSSSLVINEGLGKNKKCGQPQGKADNLPSFSPCVGTFGQSSLPCGPALLFPYLFSPS